MSDDGRHEGAPDPLPEINFLELESRMSEAVSEYINGVFPDLPPIRWSCRPPFQLKGQVPEYEYARPESVAQAWSSQLGPGDGVDDEHGTRSFAGEHGVYSDVEVWYVTDRARFEQ
jgi:hypothetical protein